MRFPIIYADPAWTYEDKALAGNRGAICKYELLDDEGIFRLPVSDIADDNSVIFLWVTMPKLAEGLTCLQRWGFTYKTCAFTWVKPNGPFHELIQAVSSGTTGDVLAGLARKINTCWAIGMGRWTRSNAELVLLGTRGKPSRVDAGVNQVICAPAMKHSAKPPEARDRIVRLCGDLPRVELFARDRVPGWFSLGNEIDGRDLRQSLPDLARMSRARYDLLMRSVPRATVLGGSPPLEPAA